MHKCSNCRIDLEMIRVLDATQPGGTSGAGQVDLHYAPVGTDATWFTGTVKGASAILSMICPRCRRIALFG